MLTVQHHYHYNKVLLYMKLLRWRTSPRHVRKYGYAAQPAWHVCVLCRTTSMYIDPGFAQLLAYSYQYMQFIIERERESASRGFFPYSTFFLFRIRCPPIRC